MANRTISILCFISVLLALVGCTSPTASSQVGVSEPTLQDMGTIDNLKARFNADAGVPRLILLVSPT